MTIASRKDTGRGHVLSVQRTRFRLHVRFVVNHHIRHLIVLRNKPISKNSRPIKSLCFLRPSTTSSDQILSRNLKEASHSSLTLTEKSYWLSETILPKVKELSRHNQHTQIKITRRNWHRRRSRATTFRNSKTIDCLLIILFIIWIRNYYFSFFLYYRNLTIANF